MNIGGDGFRVMPTRTVDDMLPNTHSATETGIQWLHSLRGCMHITAVLDPGNIHDAWTGPDLAWELPRIPAR